VKDSRHTGILQPRGRRRAFLAVALLAWAIVPGCGDGKPYQDTSMREATVTGVVTAKGVPVTEGGEILFNGSNSGRIVSEKSAAIGTDGRYTIKAVTGDNRVRFAGKELVQKYPGLGLHQDYASVQAGENTIDFDLLEGGKKATLDTSRMPKQKKR
jgi:hypothetical protein